MFDRAGLWNYRLQNSTRTHDERSCKMVATASHLTRRGFYAVMISMPGETSGHEFLPCSFPEPGAASRVSSEAGPPRIRQKRFLAAPLLISFPAAASGEKMANTASRRRRGGNSWASHCLPQQMIWPPPTGLIMGSQSRPPRPFGVAFSSAISESRPSAERTELDHGKGPEPTGYPILRSDLEQLLKQQPVRVPLRKVRIASGGAAGVRCSRHVVAGSAPAGV